MCAIAGSLALFGAPAPDPGQTERMIRLLRHRGPDGTGFYHDGPVALGHARLSIIDLDSGQQPLCNEDATVHVTFNGEIFNYIELRAELAARGHRLSTHSDTEVLVHLYEDHGADLVHHLNGQFAFGLWDKRQQRLVLCRDRAGIRPLFYTVVGDELLFASEIKALLACEKVRRARAIDLQGLRDTLTFWAPLPPRTIFAGIHCLPPGHILTCQAQTGEITVRRYWDWRFPEEGDDGPLHISERAELLRERLTRAARLQLRADVPVGAYLSGGLDSSLIAALVREHGGPALRTFSIAFGDEEFDESRYQQQMAQHLGTDHTCIQVTRRDIGMALPAAVLHAEAPLLRSAPAPLYLLSQAVRRAGYKVVLTGEGADEVFGGYDLFKEAQVRRFWARQPDSKSRPRILSRLYPYLKSSPSATPAYAQAFFGQHMSPADQAAPCFGHLPRWATTSRTLRFLRPEVQAQIAGYDPIAALCQDLPPEIGRWAPLCRDQYIEVHTLLSPYLLSSQGDRMAMANGVEGRFPFLDHHVIEHAAELPVLCKMMGLKEKYLLKRAAEDLLPREITARTKQPYRAPDAISLFSGDGGAPLPWVAELLSEQALADQALFDPALVRRLVSKCQAGRAVGFGDNMALLGVVTTLLLDQLFLRERPSVDLPLPRRFAVATPADAG